VSGVEDSFDRGGTLHGAFMQVIIVGYFGSLVFVRKGRGGGGVKFRCKKRRVSVITHRYTRDY